MLFFKINLCKLNIPMLYFVLSHLNENLQLLENLLIVATCKIMEIVLEPDSRC